MSTSNYFVTFLFMGLAGVLCISPAATAEPPDLEEGVKLEADGTPIEVRIGHLVPVVVDWDGDGKKDLLVGQFLQGKIRLYRNVGTDAKPVFKDFEFVKARGVDISVPAG